MKIGFSFFAAGPWGNFNNGYLWRLAVPFFVLVLLCIVVLCCVVLSSCVCLFLCFPVSVCSQHFNINFIFSSFTFTILPSFHLSHHQLQVILFDYNRNSYHHHRRHQVYGSLHIYLCHHCRHFIHNQWLVLSILIAIIMIILAIISFITLSSSIND